jgi:hypothetical protein
VFVGVFHFNPLEVNLYIAMKVSLDAPLSIRFSRTLLKKSSEGMMKSSMKTIAQPVVARDSPSDNGNDHRPVPLRFA